MHSKHARCHVIAACVVTALPAEWLRVAALRRRPETPPSTAGAWGLPAAQQQEQQQPHQQRSFKPSWNKAGSKNSLE